MPRKPSPVTTLADHPDLLDKFGAGILADHINEYWRERGFTVRAERYELPGSKAWGVRSDMMNGLPVAFTKFAQTMLTINPAAKSAAVAGVVG